MNAAISATPNAQAAHVATEIARIIEARHHDPFAVLGRHYVDGRELLRAFVPGAVELRLYHAGGEAFSRIAATAMFELQPAQDASKPYAIWWRDDYGNEHREIDPYQFPSQLPDFDLHLFGEGRHWHLYRLFGAHSHETEGVAGLRFAVWAPNAERVSVVGDFNRWDGRRHPMRVRGGSGVWELFIPGLEVGALYKFEIRATGGLILLKSDPYAQCTELRPNTASIAIAPSRYGWEDRAWMSARSKRDWLHSPMSIYEVHLGSWRRKPDGSFLSYHELADELIPYVKELGFNYLELLPVTEHPFDDSWGYQTTGYFAPTRRFGNPDDLRYFIDRCHQNGIGVILDWVPGHFPKDAHGLARFDGSALYEHEDPRLGEHREWGTLIFNYGRKEVKNFLLSSALYWLEEYHLDGLRVDAVASMLYLDYSRQPGDWVPNRHGGNENLEAIDFLRELNTVVHDRFPGSMVVAEESTAWPQVTRPTSTGGLGFSIKWNMGWMHDSLLYMSKDPIHRHYHHNNLTFGLLYAFTENFLLPFSHDEVVHGKGSLLNRMPGDEWQRFANLRLLFAYQFTYPGKKLLFMGCEYGQGNEWNHHAQLDWWVLQYPLHRGLKALVGDLNRLYRNTRALHAYDFDPEGFEWIDCHDATQSVLSYLRVNGEETVVVVLNFTPLVRKNYRLGVPLAGDYQEILNTDSMYYGGSNVGNALVRAEAKSWMNRPYSISLTLPPLGAIVLIPRGG